MRSSLLLLLLLCSARLGVAAPSPAVLRAADDFSRVAEQANPWVVNISTTQYVKQRIGSYWQDYYGFDPFGGMGGGTRTFKRQSLGSGFIYSRDGLVLTNAHVVAGADEIVVRLVDGTEAKATVVGEDANVDLALLRIAVGRTLTAATLGDSSRVKMGEWAIAIGNPFGFDHSLTVGVISAKERTNIFQGEGSAKYQNYLQTDASINHGNSGGPLCNIRGQVIGMNTAISTPNDGSIGIGFAIPINFIKRSVPDLLRAGKVVAPKLGFFTQDMNPDLAKALKVPGAKGVLVTDVAVGEAAEKAGMRRGDVLQKLNGADVDNAAELRTHIYEAEPDKPLQLRVWREGRTIDLQLQPSRLKTSTIGQTGTWHGMQVVNNDPRIAKELGLALAEGVVVTQVASQSSAGRIGIQAGDVLLEINQQRVLGEAEWKKLTAKTDEGQDAVLLLLRGRQSAYVVVPAEE